MEKEEQIAALQRQIEEMELIYQYLTGRGFVSELKPLSRNFSDMHTDLERERKVTTCLRAQC